MKSQIWIAVSTYVLVDIIKKRLTSTLRSTLRQMLSVTSFEKTPLQQAFPADGKMLSQCSDANQLNLFDS